jgi:hypothetical protein
MSAAERASDIDRARLIDRLALGGTGQRRFEPVGAASVIDVRPRRRPLDQQPPPHHVDRVLGVAPEVPCPLGDTEHRPDAAQH